MRAESAAFCDFKWSYPTFLRAGQRHIAWCDGIQILGTQEFITRTEEALRLLWPLAEYRLIREHIGCIVQSRRSGMKAWLKPPIFAVGRATWTHSALWYAGAIAYDAYHSKLYRDRHRTLNLSLEWTGTTAERSCLVFQSQVLSLIGANPAMIAYVDNFLQTPTYQGHAHGWRAWLDYLKRWW